MKNLFALVAAFLIGCGTIPQNVITITSTVDSAAKEYAHLYNAGTVSDGLDRQVEQAHLTYRKAAKTAKEALIAYKISKDDTQYIEAFIQAQRAASAFVELIAPIITAEKSILYKNQIKKATAP